MSEFATSKYPPAVEDRSGVTHKVSIKDSAEDEVVEPARPQGHQPLDKSRQGLCVYCVRDQAAAVSIHRHDPIVEHSEALGPRRIEPAGNGCPSAASASQGECNKSSAVSLLAAQHACRYLEPQQQKLEEI